MNALSTSVAEMQGLYGAYSFSEHLLQKIWLRGEFDRERAVTEDGTRVNILHPGQWNRLGGPDFKNARLRLGENDEITGDVELHLHAEDWDAHGHARDPAYNRVVLHVVLFPPKRPHVLGAAGRKIPALSLLTLLLHDLEEFAADEAVERLAARPAGRIIEELAPLAQDELKSKLRAHAETRWRQKVHFARLRVQRLGWEAACHQTALEILGFRFNRAPMLRLATRFPISHWAIGKVSPDEALAIETEGWSVQGVRPANQPRARIIQYLRWTRQRPSWPALLAELALVWPCIPIGAETRDARRESSFGAWRTRLADEVCGDAVGGTRLETLIVDGLMPLMATRRDREGEFLGAWFHWFPGDLPPLVPRALRDLGVVIPGDSPATNGFCQGLLGWWWQREATEAAAGGRGA